MIARNANDTLAHLTNNEWQVEFDELSDNELEISCYYFSHGFERNFDFISGGEKFCVAISVALAIGQSLQEGRTVDTLIIDEGFGSLDDNHRISLVKELERLSSEVLYGGRIIVVSHQEDVHDEFGSRRYHITKDAGGYVHIKSGLS